MGASVPRVRCSRVRVRTIRAPPTSLVELRRRPEAAPDAGRRPPLEEDGERSLIACLRDQQRRFACLADARAASLPAAPPDAPRAPRRTSSLMGHTVQAGRVRVQSVAPRSMMAWVYAAMRSAGVHASRPRHSAASTARRARVARRCRIRARARAWRCRPGSDAARPRDSARIAPAVERPMPGSAVTSSMCRGKLAVEGARPGLGRRRAGYAHGRSTRVRSRDAAPHPPAPPPAPRRSEIAP